MRIKPLLLLTAALMILVNCAPKDAEKMLKGTTQDAAAYTSSSKDGVIITQARQLEYRSDYLKHFYRPWSATEKVNNKEIWQHEKDEFAAFYDSPGYGENKKKISRVDLNLVKENMHLDDATTNPHRAITLNTADVRRLPTDKPTFKNFNRPGDDYPFDIMQDSIIAANTPILELSRTKDNQWSLVECHYIMGWIKSTDLGYVDDAFVKEWESSDYVVPLEREVPLSNQSGQFLTNSRFGSIVPTKASDQSDHLKIITASRDQSGHAIIIPISVSKDQFASWPLPATVANFDKLINKLQGEPYGWGGMYGYRDCSSTLQDLFANFGVWLPRSSKEQAKIGQFVDLRGYSNSKKLDKIARHAKPLLTIMNIHGHVMLYLVSKDDTAYVFQNMWGIHTRRLGQPDGRIVIGRSVITPIDMGRSYLDTKGKTALDRVFGMSTLSGA